MNKKAEKTIPCSLEEILDSISSCCLRLISEKKESIILRKCVLYNISPYIMTDPVSLAQIMNNVICTTLKLSGKGVIEFGVSLKEDHRIQLYLKHIGIEISPEQRKALLSSLPQVDSCGLAMSRKAVKSMGGEMTFQASRGKEYGFQYSLILPYMPVEE